MTQRPSDSDATDPKPVPDDELAPLEYKSGDGPETSGLHRPRAMDSQHKPPSV